MVGWDKRAGNAAVKRLGRKRNFFYLGRSSTLRAPDRFNLEFLTPARGWDTLLFVMAGGDFELEAGPFQPEHKSNLPWRTDHLAKKGTSASHASRGR